MCPINVKEAVDAIKNGQSRETGNIGHKRHKTKTNKRINTAQYVLDTTMHKQTQITKIRHESAYTSRPTNN